MSNPTLVEVRFAVLKFFEQENVFMFSENHEQLVKSDSEPDVKAALIKEAMAHFESIDMAKKFTVRGKDAWVLSKPLAAYDQPVQIGCELALGISSIVNEFCKSVNSTRELVDPMNIRERDIKNLVYIAELLVEEKSKAANQKQA